MAKVVFKGRMFNVEAKPMKIGKATFQFEYIASGGAIVVVPVLPDGRIIIEKIYRHALGKWVYEFPAGHIEKGEAPKAAAIRELEEETGYRAGKMEYLFKAYASPGIGNELLYFFAAAMLRKTRTNREATEEIRLEQLSLEKLSSMVMSNKIDDAKTIAALLFYRIMPDKGSNQDK